MKNGITGLESYPGVSIETLFRDISIRAIRTDEESKSYFKFYNSKYKQ